MAMNGLTNISKKIFVGIFTGTLVVISLSTIADYFFTKKVISDILINLVDRTFNAAYNDLSSEIAPIITQSEATAYAFFNNNISEEELCEYQENTLDRYPRMYSVEYMYYSKVDGQGWFLFNAAKKQRGNKFEKLNTVSDFDSLFVSQQIVLDADTLRYFYTEEDGAGVFRLRYDVCLADFVHIINKHTGILPSRHYLFDNNGALVGNVGKKQNSIAEEEYAAERELVKSIVNNGRQGLLLASDFDNKRALFIAPLKGTEYTIASSIYTEEVIRKYRKIMWMSYLFSVVAFVILAYVLQRIIVRLTMPISELTEISRKIEQGSLHTAVPEYSGDGDSAQISKALRSVQSRMHRYVQSLNSTLKTKRAYESDLKIANRIQLDMIPGPRRALTDYPEVDLFAEMIPARGVAGDFYDYFFLDKENLFFVIGDVSGKGIPAALFMVKALTLIEREAIKKEGPGKVFAAVNNQLCLKNEEGMFVTAIAGVVNIKTGDLKLCDAGHNAPIFSFQSGATEYGHINKSMPLGILGDKEYEETHLQLSAGDLLLFYTDGFPECVGENGTMLGEEALLESVKGKEQGSLTEISGALWSLIQGHRNKTSASDDTTLLIIRYQGE